METMQNEIRNNDDQDKKRFDERVKRREGKTSPLSYNTISWHCNAERRFIDPFGIKAMTIIVSLKSST
jgi:hypothetical protein